MKILILEDKPSLDENPSRYLSSKGYSCESVLNYRAALSRIDLYAYDCIILDIMPGGGSTHLLDRLNAENRLEGVIVTCDQEMLDDAIKEWIRPENCFIKPVNLPGLAMRVNAITHKKTKAEKKTISFREVTVNTNTLQVTVNGQHILLTKTEYKFLLYFIVNRNTVLTMDKLAGQIWRGSIELSNNFDLIYTNIKNLRKKMQSAGCANYLHSIYGRGYTFS